MMVDTAFRKIAPGTNCPICGASTRALGRRHDHGNVNYELFGCRSCGVHHWTPLEHPGAAYYEAEEVAIYRALHDGAARGIDPRFARFYREFGRLGSGRILDIGCSDGAFLSGISPATERWGIDIDERALAVAVARGLINAKRATIGEFVADSERASRSFDFITAFDVIEHLTDPVESVRALARILRPGGWLVGTVPNRERILVDEMEIDRPPHHFFRFDKNGAGELMKRAGLDVERLDVFQYNYAMKTLLALVNRVVRGRKLTKPNGEAGSSHSRGGWRSTKRALRLGLEWSATPLSYAVEAPGRRGFKLYFAAQKRTSG